MIKICKYKAWNVLEANLQDLKIERMRQENHKEHQPLQLHFKARQGNKSSLHAGCYCNKINISGIWWL